MLESPPATWQGCQRPALQPGAPKCGESNYLLQLFPEEQTEQPGPVPPLWALIKALPFSLHNMTNHPL